MIIKPYPDSESLYRCQTQFLAVRELKQLKKDKVTHHATTPLTPLSLPAVQFNVADGKVSRVKSQGGVKGGAG